jgi:hypothetical protein
VGSREIGTRRSTIIRYRAMRKPMYVFVDFAKSVLPIDCIFHK